jgi:hypothetical protein
MATPNETVTSDQVQALPKQIAAMIRGAVSEYEAGAPRSHANLGESDQP